MRFNPNVIHVSGKQQITADALSRAPASLPSSADVALVNDTDAMAQQTLDNLPASSCKLQEIITQQQSDPEVKETRNFCQRGWPAFMPQNPLLQQYWANQRYLTIIDDILLYYHHIVVPTNMRLEMLNKLYESHLGVTKCRALAETSVWWPNISSHIQNMVRKCGVCAKLRPVANSLSYHPHFLNILGHESPWIFSTFTGRHTSCWSITILVGQKLEFWTI
ncbi:Pol polyprotein [Elysia marginata]|uniref:Pol polyprotein n=1 Tax=Elysia marginata TaxID=1093978 RepID=A0AAV4K0H4_9GAST|nr:Pol polyprotein [Elysia marginata]